MELAKQARTGKSGDIHLSNASNSVWGYLLSWATLVMAVLLLNRSILTDSDPMVPMEVVSYAIPLAMFSNIVMMVFGRTRVLIRGVEIVVRNPLVRYVIPLSLVDSIHQGSFGFPVVSASGMNVRLAALEVTLLDHLRGGSEGLLILREAAESERGAADRARRATIQRTWAPIDGHLAALLLAWGAYALHFAI